MTIATITRESRFHDLLADGVAAAMAGTDTGHCARVDYLNAEEAAAICRSLRARSADFASFVLGDQSAQTLVDAELYCSADTAIERRNRKDGRLCLFVPVGLVDATISSLGNSFAAVDGRDLYHDAEKRLLGELAPTTRATLDVIKRQLRGSARPPQAAILELSLATERHVQAGTLDALGRELWRVGLIADSGDDFEQRLARNKECASLMARPARLSASYRDRIATLKVDTATAQELEKFFARRPLHDIRAWSRAMDVGEGPTFDRWIFPDAVVSDLVAVRIRPFTENGALVKGSKFLKLDAAGEPLRAECGERHTLTIHWTTEPSKAKDVHGWRVSLVPSVDDDLDDADETLNLPSRQTKGAARSLALRLNIAKDELPSFAVCARVVALDATGAELQGMDNQPLADKSEEFYLVEEGAGPPERTTARRKTVATLGLGRLLIAREATERTFTFGQAAWLEGSGTAFFSMRADDAKKTQVYVGTSPFLLAIQRRTLREPQTGGRYTLACDEVIPVTIEQVVADPIVAAPAGAWSDFWRTRAGLFGRIASAAPYDALEATDWNRDLTAAAVRYASVYTSLLDGLAADVTPEGRVALQSALSVDTLSLTLHTGADEEAIVVLPTHPLRIAWFAGHGSLLRKWEDEILSRSGPQRRQTFDPGLLADLRPANVPAFTFSSLDTAAPFVFFQNLHFFYGVALPAHARDPHRRYLDVATVVGAQAESVAIGDQRPDRLTEHLRDFRTIHPYTDPLTVTLVNPDHGEFFAQAIDPLLRPPAGNQDDSDAAPDAPAFTITAYVMDEANADLSGLRRLRQPTEQTTRRPTDYLQPSLATAVRPIADLQREGMADTHIAILSDLSQPRVQAYPDGVDDVSAGSLSLYGLIVRFVSTLHSSGGALAWRHRIIVPQPGKADENPAEARLSSALIALHRAVLAAIGRLLAPEAAQPNFPCLEVAIDANTADLLEEVHAHADWVVTVDRFFGIDYYDSPHHEALSALARKYLIDYAPEFVDGLGHRSIVTTAWRDEVGAILRRAMTELGFASVDTSVRRLLHYLKTVSGRLALEALSRDSSGTAAVSLAAVTAWLQHKGRLAQGFLVPVDAHRGLFWPGAAGAIQEGERRCDLALFTLKRGIVEASFIEVKWRRGPLSDIGDLGQDMAMQMRASAAAMEHRFFNPERVDGPLQRAYLASVLRFYCERARRYDLLAPDTADLYLGYLRQLEREGLSFRAHHEGYIVSLESRPRPHLDLDDETTITLLSATDFEAAVAELPVTASRAAAPNVAQEEVSNGQDPLVENGVADTTRPSRTATETTWPRQQGAGQAESTTDTASMDIDSHAGDADGSGSRMPIQIVLGTAGAREAIWKPSVQGSPHLFITGIPGQGKSWTTMRLLIELRRQEVPALVFDFHGQMGEVDSSYVRATHPQVIDASTGLPFSPFECGTDSGQTGWEASAAAIADIFAYVCGLGDIQHDTLFTTIRVAYRACGFGEGQDGAAPPSYPTLQDVLRRLERAEGSRQTQNVVARCRPLLEMDLFRPPENGRSNLMASIRDGLVVDLHGLHSETLQNAAGAFILRKLYTDMFSWGMADRIRLALVLDEAHRLARDITLPKIMKEGRKFGILVLVASQGLRDFHQDVLGNAGTKIAFRANFPEARKIAGFFQTQHGQELAGILANLRVGSALVQTPEMRAALQVHMAPLENSDS